MLFFETNINYNSSKEFFQWTKSFFFINQPTDHAGDGQPSSFIIWNFHFSNENKIGSILVVDADVFSQKKFIFRIKFSKKMISFCQQKKKLCLTFDLHVIRNKYRFFLSNQILYIYKKKKFDKHTVYFHGYFDDYES